MRKTTPKPTVPTNPEARGGRGLSGAARVPSRWVALVLVTLVAIVTPSLAAAVLGEATDTQAAREVVSQTIDEVLVVLRDSALGQVERQKRVEAIAYTRFDFETMSKLVMARNWKRLTEDQKTTFIREFKALLSRSYGGRLERWGDQKVKMAGERVEPRGDVTVKTEIAGGSFDGASIDYRLRKSKSGVWKVIDVVAEGISLVSNYRTQFRDVMARGGAEKLLKRMQEKNEEALAGSDD